MAAEDDNAAPRTEGEARNKAGSPGRRRSKLDVFNAVLSRLSSSNSVAISPELKKSLWAHFNRLPASYAADFTVERAEDALTHMQLLQLARDPVNSPIFSVQTIQVPGVIDGNTPKYEQNSNLQELDSENEEDTVHGRMMYEIIFPADDKPKVLSQLTSVIGDLGLNIQEAHAYSTNDGLSLVVFIAVGWLDEDQLKQELNSKIGRAKELEMKDAEQVPTSLHGHVDIPNDETSVWEINYNLLSFDKIVASGSYGDLYKGTYCSQEVAIKVLKNEGLNANVLREFVHEVQIMRKIRHKNVVKFIGACTRPMLCIVTEFMSGGSIYDYLHKENEFFKMPALLQAAIDVSKGMNYLHQNNVIHRDLKTANILMDENKDKRCYQHQLPVLVGIRFSQNKMKTRAKILSSIDPLLTPFLIKLRQMSTNRLELLFFFFYCDVNLKLKSVNVVHEQIIKVGDFGVARVKSQSGVMTAETGTYRWMAPEVIDHKPYDHKADVFSFGILLWELLTGKIPYDDMTPVQAAVGVVQKGLRPTIPKEINSKLAELIAKCWQQDPNLRPDFSQILEALHAVAKEVKDTEKHKTKPHAFFAFRRNRNQ